VRVRERCTAPRCLCLQFPRQRERQREREINKYRTIQEEDSLFRVFFNIFFIKEINEDYTNMSTHTHTHIEMESDWSQVVFSKRLTSCLSLSPSLSPSLSLSLRVSRVSLIWIYNLIVSCTVALFAAAAESRVRACT